MRCALELRERGFDGHLCMLSAESTPRYDRTLVSKALISGDPVDAERVLLQSLEAYDDAAIELRLGVRATALEAADGRLLLADGSRVAYDRLVLAVGGEPARPPQLMADGVVTLRELADALRLEPVLGAVGRVVVIGGGFIGTEVASMAVARGLDATIVEAALPFAPALGERVAERICAMHRARGVTLLTGTPVDRVRRAGPAFRVDLADGRHVPGAAPASCRDRPSACTPGASWHTPTWSSSPGATRTADTRRRCRARPPERSRDHMAGLDRDDNGLAGERGVEVRHSMLAVVHRDPTRASSATTPSAGSGTGR
jgi:NADPH-dependent 2,4-dienoyl-CoA reductase/sulfur reductase-like enzyme